MSLQQAKNLLIQAILSYFSWNCLATLPLIHQMIE
jgi:hypothetical protein